ncbi:MAG: hypothetical protein GY772_17520 [bacterium]|nr:hypothetical protein [bacterium]
MSFSGLGALYPVVVDVPIIGKQKGTVSVPVDQIVSDIRAEAGAKIPGLTLEAKKEALKHLPELGNRAAAEAKRHAPDVARSAASGLVAAAVVSLVLAGAVSLWAGYKVGRAGR